MCPNIIDMTGKIFGRLKVIKYSHFQNNCAYWKCLCDCGKIHICRGGSLRHGLTKSCGCLNIEVHRLSKGESGLRNLYSSYKNRAKHRKIKFKLTLKQFKQLTQQNCYYCNLEPKQVSKLIQNCMTKSGTEHSKYYYNGIDRLNNNKGYIKENCVPCCKTCNFAKHKMNEYDFYSWIERLHHHIVKENRFVEY
jgi:hypothetical protein